MGRILGLLGGGRKRGNGAQELLTGMLDDADAVAKEAPRAHARACRDIEGIVQSTGGQRLKSGPDAKTPLAGHTSSVASAPDQPFNARPKQTP